MSRREWVAYFSMEIAVGPEIPTYSGGLGILAGDTLRAASDLELPFVAVTLLHRRGYFRQKIDQAGNQIEEAVEWPVEQYLEEMKQRVAVMLEGRTVYLRAWRYQIVGATGFKVPVYFLDSDLGENEASDRALTHYLYGQDQRYRLCQEVIFGIGGIRMLKVLGYSTVRKFHMNEGHAALMSLELLEEQKVQRGKTSFDHEDLQAVKNKCVFTTHTPVPAGHDRFSMDLVHQVMGQHDAFNLKDVFWANSMLNMTEVALHISGFINGVSQKHAEVTRGMFPHQIIHGITNGVHAATWVSKPFQELYDRYLAGWRRDNARLRYATQIPRQEIGGAHEAMKQELIHEIGKRGGTVFGAQIFTIGFARRMTGYKRAALLFHDTARLKKIADQAGGLQIVYAGKAHPQDPGGKDLIKKIIEISRGLSERIKVVYLENYDMGLGKRVISGVDLWLNNPEVPLEASGTSGMKAALNGVPSLSTLDGWWIEGCVEGITGWSIQAGPGDGDIYVRDAKSLYDKLEHTVIPLFKHQHDHYLDVMAQAIAFNGSYFHTERMVKEYLAKAYF